MTLVVGEGLLQQSLSLLCACGAGRRECVVIWVGDARGHAVSRVLHPRHASDRCGYRIDGVWVSALYAELAEHGERVIAQVHTHPNDAFHSRRDDARPIVLEAGLYSLVIPRFATKPIQQSDWYLTELQNDGAWQERPWQKVTP